jgi:hypothetical protein
MGWVGDRFRPGSSANLNVPSRFFGVAIPWLEVKLRRANVGMAGPLLDLLHLGAMLQGVCDRRLSQGMNANVAAAKPFGMDADPAGVFFHYPPNCAAVERLPQ